MNGYLIILIYISSFFLFACNVRMNNPVVQPTFTSPFQIVQEEPYVILPDSLGRDSLSGSAILEGRIKDNSLYISDIRIMRLDLTSIGENRNVMNYYYGIDSLEYAKEFFRMKKFIPFFEEYFNSLKVIKLDDREISRDYVLTIKVLFRPQLDKP